MTLATDVTSLFPARVGAMARVVSIGSAMAARFISCLNYALL
jgi:hypothetical protein